MSARPATLDPPSTCSLSNILHSSTPVLRLTLLPSLDASPPRDPPLLPSPSPLLHDPIHPHLIHNPLLSILQSPPPHRQPVPHSLLPSPKSATSRTTSVTHPPHPVLHLHLTSTNTLHRTFFVSSLPFSSKSLMRTMSYQSLLRLPSSPNPLTFLRIVIPTHPSGHPSLSRLAQRSQLLPLISHFMPAQHRQSPSNLTSSVF